MFLEILQNSQENICARVSFLIKLNDTEVAQNNSVFVWKTANCSCGRENLRNNMSQVKNLKSLDFTWKRIAKLLNVFPEVVLYDIHRLLCFPWCCFWFPYFFNRPFCGRPCYKSSIICISCWRRWFTSVKPKAFTSPPSSSCTGEQSS